MGNNMEPGTALQGQINVVVELSPVLMHFTELESDEGHGSLCCSCSVLESRAMRNDYISRDCHATVVIRDRGWSTVHN